MLNLIFERKIESTILHPRDSYLLPPDGDPNADYGENIADEVKQIAADAAKRLALKNKHGKVTSQSQIKIIKL
jgi:hypothetical protein